MEYFVKQRDSAKSQIKKLLTRVNKHDTQPLDSFELAICESKITKLSDTLDTIHSHIVTFCTNEFESDDQEEIYTKMEEKIDQIRTKLMQIQDVVRASNAATTALSSSSTHKQRLVRLPAIELPSFDGSYEGWISFQDLFLATIHSNSDLSGAQKLQYLKSAVCCNFNWSIWQSAWNCQCHSSTSL